MSGTTPAALGRRLTGSLLVAAVGSAVLLVGPPARLPGPGTASGTADRALPAQLRLVAASPQHWPRWRGHPGRRIKHYRVHRGDTATGLAVRFHAWTDELRTINSLGRHAHLYVGDRIRIPVVMAAWRRDHARPHHRTHRRAHRRAPHRVHRAAHHRHPAQHRLRPGHSRPSSRPWRHADASRHDVRGVLTRTAQRHGINPRLALAISWQESGWQQRRLSPAGAVGVMQVMPSTGRWISTYVGRRLNLYGLHDNATAGVVLVKVLQDTTSGHRVIGSYYQGLGSIRQHGMYPSTKAYLRSVLAIRKRLTHGRSPS